MKKYTRKLGKVIQIDETKIQEHLGELVRGTVEECQNHSAVSCHIDSAVTPWYFACQR